MPNDAIITAPAGVKRSRLRRLRIAASVFFAVVTVALCVLWVRSYWQFDVFEQDKTFGIRIVSAGGSIQLRGVNIVRPGAIVTNWSHETILPREKPVAKVQPWKLSFPRVINNGILTFVVVPYWSAAAAAVSLAISPFLKSRFSLRTLLISTTLVAVVLGLRVWAAG